MLEAGPVAPEPVRLFFRRPPFWSGTLTWGVTGSWLGLYVLYGLRAGSADPLVIAVGAVLALLPLALIVWRLTRRPRDVPPIEVGPTHLSLPRSADSSRVVTARYADLRSLSLRQRGQRQFLVVETAEGAFVYPAMAFADPHAIERFLGAMRERLTTLPGGMDILRVMAQRDELMRAAVEQRPTATYGLMAAIALGFLAQILFAHPYNSLLELLRFGANSHGLVVAGEWWRLFTASFLHGHFMHILINGIAVISLGPVLERVLGPWRMVLVYLGSGVGGAAASAFIGRAPASVGASTALFGLFGALIVANIYYRRDLPIVFRQPWAFLAFMLGLNVLLSISFPMIDAAAHFGGLAAGVVLTLPLLGKRQFVFDRPTGLGVRIATLALIAAHVAALALAVRGARDTSDAAMLRRISLMGSGHDDADAYNMRAWLVATASDAKPPQLEVALELIERALAMTPGDWQMLDTRATVLYRLGRFDEALDESAAALRAQERDADPTLRALPEIATQLARFLEARARKGGTRFDGGLGPDAVRLSVEGGQPQKVIAELRDVEAPHGLVVYAVARRSGERVGLVRVRLGAAQLAEERLSFADATEPRVLSPGTQLVLLWADGRGCDCGPQLRELKVWPNDPAVDFYP